ncbi:trans-sulfuration enzyme family protein [Actinomadura alba]|uniref:Aminotransferase class I/II-fold pyridoxal phosphate-dependent enzyme n=1 Tax=Actinomadura alba TaxID=406431 RepID=A0ABR7LMH7_9ACTN|nr:aminotransferase class I/II-fold pyridoxal phosphate-dependent enzyme [Actinomadura alba]MBC6466040.1 aminotransferase class I/II-fold pyridoxal phosphate-dependent enzyme [Actinomadura alba]
MTQHHRETRAIHVPIPLPSGSRALNVPLYQGGVFAFDDADEMAAAFDGPPAGAAEGDGEGVHARGGFIYSRLANPTVRALEDAVADLEGGAGALAAGSGMGAINTVLRGLLRTGDHVIAQRCLYGGTHTTLRELTDRWGVEVTYVSGDDPEEVRAALRPRTRILYLETIANPTTQVVDLPALIAAAPGVVSVVDNTFATPLLCRPIEYGADVVVHSATKYLSGHADVLAGVAVFADAGLLREVWDSGTELGATADPFAAWLILRGMATLSLRMERHCSNAQTLAERLSAHPAVAAVHYPGLPSHPGHEIGRRILSGSGGVLSFDLAGGRAAGRTFIEAVRLASLAASLGDVKTLVMHPASTSHRKLDAAMLAAAGIGEGTVRIAVGIEHPEDIWSDLEQALTKAG